MTEINDNTPSVGDTWRGVRDALAKRDSFYKFPTKGQQLPHRQAAPWGLSAHRLAGPAGTARIVAAALLAADPFPAVER